MKKEIDIIKEIENNLRQLQDKQVVYNAGDLVEEWGKRVTHEPKRFINSDFTINKEALKNFRKHSIFLYDVPSFNASLWNFKTFLGGGRRGVIKLLVESLEILKKYKYNYLLSKHPPSLVGNPYIFNYDGYKYTYRWLRHIYSLGLLKDVLGKEMETDFVALDIGSSYGIFSYLLKREFRKCHCVLIDFPEQLLLAHYFLAMNFPDLSVSFLIDSMKAKTIDRDLLLKNDFILIPLAHYNKISPNSIDLVTNFASFAEMKRKWFDYYLKHEPFGSTKYFFTVNRFQSMPTFDTDITIMDYPLEDFKKLHFRICPMYFHAYRKKCMFLYEKFILTSQFFEFIGERL